MPLSDLQSIGGAMGFVHDDIVVEMSETTPAKIKDALGKLKEIAEKTGNIITMPTGLGKTIPVDSEKTHPIFFIDDFHMPKKTSAPPHDYVYTFHNGYEARRIQTRRERLREGAVKIVKNATRRTNSVASYKANKKVVAHYNPATYGRDRSLDTKSVENPEEYLINAIVSFSIEHIEEIETKAQEERRELTEHYDKRTSELHNKMFMLQKQINTLQAEKEAAIAELAVIREREARLLVVDSTDGRRFRHEE